MTRIPSNATKRATLSKYYELRKLMAEVEELESKNASARASIHKAQVYTCYDEVSQESIRAWLSDLTAWSREFPGRPLTVIFNSPGGYVSDGLALYDFLLHLRAQGHHLTTVALGQAASMGGVLLQCGDVRVIGPNAQMLIHEVSFGTEGKVSQVAEDLRQAQREQDRVLNILAHRSKMSKADIKKAWHKKDWWLDAHETVRLGFADEVLGLKHTIQSGNKTRRSARASTAKAKPTKSAE